MSDTSSFKQADSIYFAANTPDVVASTCLSRAQSFFNMLRANAYLEKLSNMWRMYHGAYEHDLGYGHRVNFTGDQGELIQFPVNHFRNLARHIYIMITSNRPIMEARAVNSDAKSESQTIIADGILDYYMREKHLEDVLNKAVELAIVLGAGYIKLAWNAMGGNLYDADPETGEFNYEGEIEFTTLTPFDVVVDGTKENWDNDWILCRSFQNRYNLMAKYPELADKIRGIPSKTDSSVYRLAVWSNDETDDIAVYEFFHRQSEALPEGRYMLFLDSDCILQDAKMPYRTIPIFRIVPAEILGTPYGYTDMFDIMPIQELINSLFSTIATNENAFGVQNLFVPRGADIAVNQLEGAMNIIEGNMKPEPLNLTQTPAEIFKFLDMCIQSAETISGVNSVARGNPEASLKSGTALALVQSMALQFVSGLQQSYVKLIENVGTGLLSILKDFAMTPKIVTLVGVSNRSMLKEFTGDDISEINRVVVDVGNPLSRTIAGRVQMAEQLLQMKLLTDPQQYFQVINTGRLDDMYNIEMKELLTIKRENEKLLNGENPLVSPTDKHSQHVQEHKAVLDDPDLRENPELVKIVMDHIEAHLNALRNTDPGLLQLIGEQQLPPLPGQQTGPSGTPPSPGGPTPNVQGGPHGVIPPPGQGPAPILSNPALGPITPGVTLSNGQAPMALPNIPQPPGQFRNLPVMANQMTPPMRK
jgi:hypothetical protein